MAQNVTTVLNVIFQGNFEIKAHWFSRPPLTQKRTLLEGKFVAHIFQGFIHYGALEIPVNIKICLKKFAVAPWPVCSIV